ncbi:MAG: helix-turn-helix domain-containing protein [Thermoguttaceae bacterium]
MISYPRRRGSVPCVHACVCEGFRKSTCTNRSKEYNAVMTKKETVTERLRRAISESGSTRYAISKATGIPESTLSRFVAKGGGVSAGNLDRLCEHLGLRLVGERPAKKQTPKREG